MLSPLSASQLGSGRPEVHVQVDQAAGSVLCQLLQRGAFSPWCSGMQMEADFSSVLSSPLAFVSVFPLASNSLKVKSEKVLSHPTESIDFWDL